MKNYDYISIRDLKNNTTKIIHVAERGSTIIVTRYGKPVATIKPFQENDLKEEKCSLYQKIKQHIGEEQPELLSMSNEKLKELNNKISAKVNNFPSWEEMDRAANFQSPIFTGPVMPCRTAGALTISSPGTKTTHQIKNY